MINEYTRTIGEYTVVVMRDLTSIYPDGCQIVILGTYGHKALGMAELDTVPNAVDYVNRLTVKHVEHAFRHAAWRAIHGLLEENVR